MIKWNYIKEYKIIEIYKTKMDNKYKYLTIKII